ncbi:MAG: SMI1/KNR4 family protein [Methanophagales archaeon]|nr:SMI1/KNR4 family protein [Methanophagales archaeon]
MDSQDDQLQLVEALLGVSLPASYAKFLLERGSDLVNGLPILGLPICPDTSSVWGATELVRACRPDLKADPKYFVAIRLLDTRALCLDLREKPQDDAPLVEVNLDKQDLPVRVHDSFEKYLQEGDRTQRRIEKALQQLEKRRKESYGQAGYDHKEGGKFPRAHHWRTFRSCVHDQVVGLTAVRYKRELNGLLIDVFIATDHPNYEEGHGVRALTMLILSDAYRSGGSMELTFTRNVNNGKVPDELVDLAAQYGISLEQAAEGKVSHEEATNLFAALIGLPSEVQELVRNLQEAGTLTLEGLSYVIASGIWTIEEATWILINAPRPEGVLLGTDFPENRLLYLESLSYGRAALAITRLQQRILVGLREEVSPEQQENIHCLVEPKGNFCILRSNQEFHLPWLIDDSKLDVQPTQSLIVLPRPRLLMSGDKAELENDIKLLQEKGTGRGIKVLLASAELKDLDGIQKISEAALQNGGIHLLFPSFTCSELDEEVDKRMARARMVRK